MADHLSYTSGSSGCRSIRRPALWRSPKLKTAVLRIAYPLGPMGRGTLANYLVEQRVPMVLGFDPPFNSCTPKMRQKRSSQLVEHKLAGVFNVAGPSPVFSLIKGVGKTPVPIPEMLLPYCLGKFGLSRLPKASVTHLKYPIVIDDGPFRTATGFEHTYELDQIMGAFKEGQL